MREVTFNMINEFKINELNRDFMGYSLEKGDIWTFHHVIIPARNGGPYARWNGAILAGKSSHPYLHVIEAYDYEKFLDITSELIDINHKGFIDTYNVMIIDEILKEFEFKHQNSYTRKGKKLIKDIYLRRNVNF